MLPLLTILVMVDAARRIAAEICEKQGIALDAARYRKAVAIGWLIPIITEKLDDMILADDAAKRGGA